MVELDDFSRYVELDEVDLVERLLDELLLDVDFSISEESLLSQERWLVAVVRSLCGDQLVELDVVPSILVEELSEVMVLLDDGELVEFSSSELEEVFSAYVLDVELDSVLVLELSVDQLLLVLRSLMSEMGELDDLLLELLEEVECSLYVLDVLDD